MILFKGEFVESMLSGRKVETRRSTWEDNNSNNEDKRWYNNMP
ncbi:MAG: hypothetical protein RMI32_07550 [Candidatus Nitrosocaldus sp.]|nr:hypothetical protein [Candidatus Nitrosocaldus sp.]